MYHTARGWLQSVGLLRKQCQVADGHGQVATKFEGADEYGHEQVAAEVEGADQSRVVDSGTQGAAADAHRHWVVITGACVKNTTAILQSGVRVVSGREVQGGEDATTKDDPNTRKPTTTEDSRGQKATADEDVPTEEAAIYEGGLAEGITNNEQSPADNLETGVTAAKSAGKNATGANTEAGANRSASARWRRERSDTVRRARRAKQLCLDIWHMLMYLYSGNPQPPSIFPNTFLSLCLDKPYTNVSVVHCVR